jgi:hypothetical protein
VAPQEPGDRTVVALVRIETPGCDAVVVTRTRCGRADRAVLRFGRTPLAVREEHA